MQSYEVLSQKIINKKALVGVIGLGQAGLPLAILFAQQGYDVIGFDLDKKKTDLINNSTSCFIDCVSNEDVAELVVNKKLKADNTLQALDNCDVLLIAVPTLLDKNQVPNLNALIAVAKTVAENHKDHSLIVVESTVYPGATEEIMNSAFNDAGLKLDEDYFIAYSPSRIDPGNKDWPIRKVPKLVGGLSEKSLDLAHKLYSNVIDVEVQKASSVKTAEMTKLFENSFRSINIAFVNRVKMNCELMGIDMWEVVDLASSKPYGFMPFYPGPGIGGDCIPTVPLFIAWKVKELGKRENFIELASEINDDMPYYIVDRTAYHLNDFKKAINGSKILIIGVAFKKDIIDTKNSPATPILRLLIEKGAEISYFDPLVDEFIVDGNKINKIELNKRTIKEQDAVMIITNHSDIDYKLLVDNAKLIYDTRNVLKEFSSESIRL